MSPYPELTLLYYLVWFTCPAMAAWVAGPRWICGIVLGILYGPLGVLIAACMHPIHPKPPTVHHKSGLAPDFLDRLQ